MSQETAAVPAEETLERPRTWMQSAAMMLQAQSWLGSMLFHIILFLILAICLGTVKIVEVINSAPAFDATAEAEAKEEAIEHFELGDAPLDPTELTTESLTLNEAPRETVEAQFNDNSPIFEEAGGGVAGAVPEGVGLGFDIRATGTGPIARGAGGDTGGGFGKNIGKGGTGSGFGSRGTGMREAMLGNGGTKASERAVAAALNWLARHQRPDGSWSLNHTSQCKGGLCGGPSDTKSDPAATAMGLLPFFAAGQTHEGKGPYRANLIKGVNWLIQHQKPNGDCTDGAHQMYAHGLCAIALCEAYGMTGDSRVGYAAQAALNFIESGQNGAGSWRYTHGVQDSDTSVHGWQVMALKSGQMAGLKVNPDVLGGARRYLTTAASGNYKSEFGYTPGAGGTPTMTAVGLLNSQYLGARRDDPVVRGGVEYLARNMPELDRKNIYYWYYATQAMHNVPGPEWDKWNRQMRRILIQTQEKKGCEEGSWSPENDAWGKQGGRMMETSLGALTLEVYYRYLPLYKLDKDQEEKKP